MAESIFTRRGCVASSLVVAGALAAGFLCGLVAARNEDTEEWHPLRGWLGLYEVSTLGKVREVGGQVLPLWPDVDGRSTAWLVARLEHHQSGTLRFVDELVLETFTARKRKGCRPVHINGKVGDNRVANLIWSAPAGRSAAHE